MNGWLQIFRNCIIVFISALDPEAFHQGFESNAFLKAYVYVEKPILRQKVFLREKTKKNCKK